VCSFALLMRCWFLTAASRRLQVSPGGALIQPFVLPSRRVAPALRPVHTNIRTSCGSLVGFTATCMWYGHDKTHARLGNHHHHTHEPFVLHRQSRTIVQWQSTCTGARLQDPSSQCLLRSTDGGMAWSCTTWSQVIGSNVPPAIAHLPQTLHCTTPAPPAPLTPTS
jgi:hypothetical protein